MRHEFERTRLLEFIDKHIWHDMALKTMHHLPDGYSGGEDYLEQTKIFGKKKNEKFFRVYNSGLDAEQDDCVEWLAYSYVYNQILYSKQL